MAKRTEQTDVPVWSAFCEAMGTRCTFVYPTGERCDQGVERDERCRKHPRTSGATMQRLADLTTAEGRKALLVHAGGAITANGAPACYETTGHTSDDWTRVTCSECLSLREEN